MPEFEEIESKERRGSLPQWSPDDTADLPPEQMRPVTASFSNDLKDFPDVQIVSKSGDGGQPDPLQDPEFRGRTGAGLPPPPSQGGRERADTPIPKPGGSAEAGPLVPPPPVR